MKKNEKIKQYPVTIEASASIIGRAWVWAEDEAEARRCACTLYADADPILEIDRRDGEILRICVGSPRYSASDKEVLIDALKLCMDALYNVPAVGDLYDQQHSDTHMTAVLTATLALEKVVGNADKGS